MEHNRIQKLLLSEYCDFSDTVLIESPFAETTRNGDGVREVALGLTASKLVIAADILKENSEFMCPQDLDASIESFELVSIYPLEFITLSVFRRRQRKTLKARLIDGRAKYYELGGMECKNVSWSLWCENVRKLLAEKQDGSSMAETTAASSSSTSTLFLLSSDVEFTKNPKKHLATPSKCRVWARYGGAGDGQSSPWLYKDLYLGPTYNELAHGYYTPIPVRFAGASLEDLTYELKDATPKGPTCKKTCSSWPCSRHNVKSSRKNEFQRGGGLCDVLFTRERKRRQTGNKSQKSYRNKPHDSGDCNSPIFDDNDHRATASDTSGMSPSSRRCLCETRQKRRSGSPRKHDLALAPKLSRFGFGVGENCRSGLYLEPWEGDQHHFRRIRSGHDHTDLRKLIDNAVSAWENCGADCNKSRTKMRHPRRYGLATAAHFFHALGPWSVQHGERESVQRTRASSVVCIRRQPMEPELRLPVSKRQLATSVSLTSLEPGKSAITSSSTKGRVVLFWTPEYWYRPRAATAAYRELRRHLSLLRDFRVDKECLATRKRFFCRRKRSNCESDCRASTSATITEKSSGILGRIFSSKDTRKKSRKNAECRDVEITQLKRLLRMDLRITAWDLDSSTLASQLTLIDRDLFLRIPCVEIEILVSQRSSRNSPNLGAWIAFSHRISCLTASEVLATKKLAMRTRMLARFINAADKCLALGNFQSCRSILAGLQSPPIYRLRATWSHLRTHHSIRYETMERLCKMFNNTKTRTYRRAWKRCERSPPALPYVGDIIGRILSDDEERAFLSKLDTFEWKNRPCRYTKIQSLYTKGEVSSIVESACNRIVSNSMSGKKISRGNTEENVEKETLVDRRRTIAKFFFSSAMMKIGYPKCESPSTKKQLKDYPWTGREQMLAQKFVSRWRRRVLTSKILAENEAKLRAMHPRRRKIIEIGTWMCDCQRHAQGYNFPGHSLAWEFLLKARYREDRENFFISLKLEPPCG